MYTERPVEELSSVARNKVLRQIFDQLPDFELRGILDTENPIREIQQRMDVGKARREGSEHKAILLADLGEIIDCSCVTLSFRQMIINEFAMSYDFGVPKRWIKAQEFAYWLDLDVEESAGIFNPGTAETIERQVFKRRVRRGLEGFSLDDTWYTRLDQIVESADFFIKWEKDIDEHYKKDQISPEL